MEHVIMHKRTDKIWTNEQGFGIPRDRVTPFEKLKERHASALVKEAEVVHQKIKLFKSQMRALCSEVYENFMEIHQESKKQKGNFTWYNFNRTVKIEVSIKDRISFDDLSILACKEKLHRFLADNVESKDAFIKQMIMDAFETSKGRLDAKKVTSLLRYKSKIKAPLFQEAMALLEESIRRPDSKSYFRVWVKDEEGAFQHIDLNFSSI